MAVLGNAMVPNERPPKKKAILSQSFGRRGLKISHDVALNVLYRNLMFGNDRLVTF